MKLMLVILLQLILIKLLSAYNYNDYNDYGDYPLNYYNKTDDQNNYVSTKKCSLDKVFDFVSENLFPDDYEEAENEEIKFSVSHLNESMAIFRRLKQYGQNVSEKLKPFMQRIMPRFTDILLQIELPVDCMASLVRIGQAAQNGHMWALKFMDSNPSMLKSGQVVIQGFSMGEYDQCLSIRSADEIDKPVIKGKYCHYTFPPPLPEKNNYESGEPIDGSLGESIRQYLNSSSKFESYMKTFENAKLLKDKEKLIRELYSVKEVIDYITAYPMGICLPSTCDDKDIEYAINKLIYPITRMPVKFDYDCDYDGKPVKYDSHVLTSIITFIILLCVTLLSTIYEFVSNKFHKSFDKQTVWHRIGKSFSIITNIKRTISTKPRNAKFGCLDGLRALCTFNIFYIHEVLFMCVFFFQLKDMRLSIPSQIAYEHKYIFLRNLSLLGIYLIIGGAMTSYTMLAKLEKTRGKFNYISFVLQRYIKTLVPIMASICMLFILKISGDGPFWNGLMRFTLSGCYASLQPTILMYSNYKMHPKSITCNFVTWYSSLDFQLHLIAPIVFIALYRFKIYGVLFNIFLIIAACFIALSPKLYGLPHFFDFAQITSLDEAMSSTVHYHWGIEQSFGNFVLGMFLGYLIRYKPNLYFGGRIGELLIWLITGAISVWGLMWFRNYYNLDNKIGSIELILYIALAKYCFTAGFVWLIYACVTDRGGFVNKFLSWKGFKLISNLSFEIYLTHIFPILYRMGQNRELIKLTDYYLLTTGAFDFIASIFLAIILQLLVTSPFANLFAILMNTRTTRTECAAKQKTDECEQNNCDNTKANKC